MVSVLVDELDEFVAFTDTDFNSGWYDCIEPIVRDENTGKILVTNSFKVKLRNDKRFTAKCLKEFGNAKHANPIRESNKKYFILEVR